MSFDVWSVAPRADRRKRFCAEAVTDSLSHPCNRIRELYISAAGPFTLGFSCFRWASTWKRVRDSSSPVIRREIKNGKGRAIKKSPGEKKMERWKERESSRRGKRVLLGSQGRVSATSRIDDAMGRSLTWVPLPRVINAGGIFVPKTWLQCSGFSDVARARGVAHYAVC